MYLKLQYCVSCAIHGKIVRYVLNLPARSRPAARAFAEAFTNTPQSVRSREGRRNRAPPPRVRFNKDGKKINPLQTGKVAGAAS
jgi:small subunit ribosomal protein S26e